MKRILLIVAALAGCLAAALLLLARRATPAMAAVPEPTGPVLPEPTANSVKLSYVELEASPHRTEQPGATQVFGWIRRGDDGGPATGGTVLLRFEDYSRIEASATEEHGRALAKARLPNLSDRRIPVQADGGWYVDLPGKAWIDSAHYTPEHGSAGSDPAGGGLPALAHTGVGIDLPLERGALELSFRADVALDVRGIVVDESGNPVEDARVLPWMNSSIFGPTGVMRQGSFSLDDVRVDTRSSSDGSFVIAGIAPQDLLAEQGSIQFLVQAKGYEPTKRQIAWEPGQPCIPAFKVVLAPKSP